ncbi:hypothetical protein AXF42_Ash015771 [Apostasia shenzhenica]|uniref:Cystatin domain-containing protein n=1 Tax=Apostasia shenzhenica TaxID=1088818 RepID=A0A2H9ZXH3_9ASPA|nr:hypothetical protein AXF42_Ash015771 [Apostasia shenzhenica]
MMSHGHRPLLLVLLLLLVFSDGVRAEEGQLWKIEPIQGQNFAQLMAMSRGALNTFNQKNNLRGFDQLTFCRTDEVQKQKVGNDVFYALTILARQGTCFPAILIFRYLCIGDLRAYRAVVALMHDGHGYILFSVTYLPWYSAIYNKNCV